MDTGYEASLLRVADAYAAQAAEHGGKSLARVATIVVNRGSFFERLRDGGEFVPLVRLAEHDLERVGFELGHSQNRSRVQHPTRPSEAAEEAG